MDDGSPAPTYAEAADFLQGNCATRECHGGTTPPTLTNDAALPDTLSTYTVAACGNATLVVPGNAQASAIRMVVQSECGAVVMPLGCGDVTCLPPEAVDALVRWLSQPDPFL